MDILEMDATDTASAIQDGAITIREVVDTYIEHIQHINPSINAMVEDRFETARKEASEKDEAMHRSTEKGELYGVPISIKEAYDVAGMKTTGGMLQYRDLVARTDSDVVARLKKSGAIILGKTNTPELCFYQETDNTLYGRTNNPWDTNRTAGGSSGGEGALLAVGGAAAGIGSDIGGSIRFPSHFNGVVSFKPGKFQVSKEGHFPPVTIPLQERMLGFGPMGKSVRDMKMIDRIINKETVESESLETFQIHMLPDDHRYPISSETQAVLSDVGDYLGKRFPIQKGMPPFFHDSSLLWQEIMSIDGGESVKKLATSSDKMSMPFQFAKAKLTGKSHIHPHLSWALTGARLFKPSSKRIEEINAFIEAGDERLEEEFQHRIFIAPVYHQGALEHGRLFEEIFSIRKTFLQYMPYVAYANVWGLPALTIPVGSDENGMPVGIQLMSIHGNENALFELGEMLEQEFRGYTRNMEWDE